jgi:hypothetical protein
MTGSRRAGTVGQRRSNSRGASPPQQAMRLVLLYPEPEKGGRGKHRQNGSETLQFSKQRLSQARAVLAYSRQLALTVRAGAGHEAKR